MGKEVKENKWVFPMVTKEDLVSIAWGVGISAFLLLGFILEVEWPA